MYKYTYAALAAPGWDLGPIRISGPGLANCLFMACQAYLTAKASDIQMIEPTWRKISIGPYLRGERDKRAYTNLFLTYGIRGFSKIWHLIRIKFGIAKDIKIIPDISDYFIPLYGHHQDVCEYLNKITRPDIKINLQGVDFSNTIAIHVRLGDYNPSLRIPLEWFESIILNISKLNNNLEFAIFSDGNDDELKLLLKHCNVRRHFYGNAFSDMIAISRCKMLIASDSTFSAWGAYIGQIPIIFNRRHFPPVHPIESGIPEIVTGNKPFTPSQEFIRKYLLS